MQLLLFITEAWSITVSDCREGEAGCFAFLIISVTLFDFISTVALSFALWSFAKPVTHLGEDRICLFFFVIIPATADLCQLKIKLYCFHFFASSYEKNSTCRGQCYYYVLLVPETPLKSISTRSGLATKAAQEFPVKRPQFDTTNANWHNMFVDQWIIHKNKKTQSFNLYCLC